MYGEREFVVFPTRVPINFRQLKSEDLTKMETPQIVMDRQFWRDTHGRVHRGYKCRECRTFIIGSKYGDLDHGCMEARAELTHN